VRHRIHSEEVIKVEYGDLMSCRTFAKADEWVAWPLTVETSDFTQNTPIGVGECNCEWVLKNSLIGPI